MTASKSYEQFVSDLNASQYAVLAGAGHLQRSGLEVMLPPHRVMPSGYWIVNKNRTGAILIPWATFNSWDQFERLDPAQGGRFCKYYRCPASLCRYVEFA